MIAPAACGLCGASPVALEFEGGWLCAACAGGKPETSGPAVIVDVAPGNCWIPRGRGRNEDGRAVVRMAGRKAYLYTVVYSALMGEPPAGLTPDHLCLNPSCINPTHIEWVTREENASRSWTRGKRKGADQ